MLANFIMVIILQRTPASKQRTVDLKLLLLCLVAELCPTLLDAMDCRPYRPKLTQCYMSITLGKN